MEEIYYCPFCPLSALTEYTSDRKGKLYVNRSKRKYHCFRCGASGKPTTLPLGLKLKRCLDTPVLLDISAPGDLLLESNSVMRTSALRYLEGRGVTLAETIKFRIRYDSADHSLWFPVYGVPGGAPLWWQGKMISAGRYHMPKGCKICKYTMFRTFGIPFLTSPAKSVILTEGIFDAMAVGRITPAVAGFGKNVPTTRLGFLTCLAESVIVMLDKDAEKEATTLTLRIRNMGLPAVMADVTQLLGDPDDTPLEVLTEIIEKAKEAL